MLYWNSRNVPKLRITEGSKMTNLRLHHDFDAALLLESVCQESVQVVALAVHPRVVGQPEILGQHQDETTNERVLKRQRIETV